MPDIAQKVRSLSDAAWNLRATAPESVQPLPPFALALFTDDRRQPDLLSLLRALPAPPDIPPLAVIFRHDRLPAKERIALAKVARAEVQSRGHLFLTARMSLERADGVHATAGQDLVSWPVHDTEEATEADRQKADMIFISPVFETVSHPGAAILGRHGAKRLTEVTDIPAFALGGITPGTAKDLEGLKIYGIGAIGAWS